MAHGGKLGPATHNLLRDAPLKGRGAASYVRGRFEKTVAEAEDDGWGSVYAGDEDGTPAVQAPPTQVTEERARSIVSRNTSPDIAFSQSVNPYRGCEHGWTWRWIWRSRCRRCVVRDFDHREVPQHGVMIRCGVRAMI